MPQRSGTRGGAARFASPLGVQDFLKATSVVAVDGKTLRAEPVLERGEGARLPRASPAPRACPPEEGFTAHARSIELRLDGAHK